MKSVYIKPLNQGVWKLPAIANFVLTGAGAGSYALSFYIEITSPVAEYAGDIIALKILSVFLVCCGFLIVASDVRRPWRSPYLLRNVGSSWMSREIMILAIAAPLVILELVRTSAALKIVAPAAALGLILSQGFMVYRSRAISAWNVPVIPLLFLSSGLVSGYGLILLFAAFVSHPLANTSYLLGAVCVIINVAFWVYYIVRIRSPEIIASTKAFARLPALLIIIVAGHVVPVVLLSNLMANPGRKAAMLVVMSTGLILFGVGAVMKTAIVLVVGKVRGIALNAIES